MTVAPVVKKKRTRVAPAFGPSSVPGARVRGRNVKGRQVALEHRPYSAETLRCAMDALRSCGIADTHAQLEIASEAWCAAVRANADVWRMKGPTERETGRDARAIAKRTRALAAELRKADSLVSVYAEERYAEYTGTRFAQPIERALFALAAGAEDVANLFESKCVSHGRNTPQHARRRVAAKVRARIVEAGGKVSTHANAETGRVGAFAQFLQTVLEVVEGRRLTLAQVKEALKPMASRVKKQSLSRRN